MDNQKQSKQDNSFQTVGIENVDMKKPEREMPSRLVFYGKKFYFTILALMVGFLCINSLLSDTDSADGLDGIMVSLAFGLFVSVFIFLIMIINIALIIRYETKIKDKGYKYKYLGVIYILLLIVPLVVLIYKFPLMLVALKFFFGPY